MPWNENIHKLLEEHGLQPRELYLLPLIPLIELMWADGVIQPAEVSILYDQVTRHLAELHSSADGEEIVTVSEAEAFLDRFLNEAPDPEKLRELRQLSLRLMDSGSDRHGVERRKRELFDSCLDIAAAAVTNYPYGKRDRIIAGEKKLLRELFAGLRLG